MKALNPCGVADLIRGKAVTEFFSVEPCEIVVDKRQALRFMGCSGDVDSVEFSRLYDECLKLYLSLASPKAVVRKTAVSFGENNEIIFDFGKTESESLKKNLQGCKSAYVFAATVGADIDRQIKRFSVTCDVRTMMFSCIASSGVECWCDYVNDALAARESLRPRFSPGYGGVPLSLQEDIFRFLDVTKKIGVCLTDKYMMVPVKSVTAIIGIREE